MTKFPYDQFSKEYLKELLSPLGQVETSQKVPGEIREIDVWFTPRPEPSADPLSLGLLGQLVENPCLFEPFRDPVRPIEIRGCLVKLFEVHAEVKRQADRNKTRIREVDLPKLWILSPTASAALLEGFGARMKEAGENWSTGIYFLPDSLRTAIVVIHQLPRTPETLWLRLLGKGQVQEQAVDELAALPANHSRKDAVLELLRSLRAILEIAQDLEREDRNLIMRLSAIYEERLAEATQQGIQQGVQQGIQQGVQQGIQQGVQQGVRIERQATIENLLRVRFGTVDEQLEAIFPALLQLSPEEFTRSLLQLSREELLTRFGEQSLS